MLKTQHLTAVDVRAAVPKVRPSLGWHGQLLQRAELVSFHPYMPDLGTCVLASIEAGCLSSSRPEGFRSAAWQSSAAMVVKKLEGAQMARRIVS